MPSKMSSESDSDSHYKYVNFVQRRPLILCSAPSGRVHHTLAKAPELYPRPLSYS